MVGAQRNYPVSWSCSTLGLAVAVLMIIHECGAKYPCHLQVQAEPTPIDAYENKNPLESSNYHNGAQITKGFTSSPALPSQPTKHLRNGGKKQLNEWYSLLPSCNHALSLKGAPGRGPCEPVHRQHSQTLSVAQAGGFLRRLKEETNLEEQPEVTSKAKSSSSHGNEQPYIENATEVEKSQDKEKASVGNEQAEQNEKVPRKAGASNLKDESQKAEQADAQLDMSGSSVSQREAAPGGEATGDSSNRKNATAQGYQRDKQKKSSKAPHLDPTAPIEELLDPANIDRGSLVKTPFSKLSVKDGPGDKPVTYEYKNKTEGEVHREAQEVYAQAHAVAAKFDKNTRVAEAKADPPKPLGWYTRFMEWSERFFAKFGKS